MPKSAPSVCVFDVFESMFYAQEKKKINFNALLL